MDFRFALRSLRSRPGFTLLAVAILALGIGANTAIFSVVNAVLLRPLDYRDPDRIVMLGSHWRTSPANTLGQVSEPDYDDIRTQTTAFDGIAAFQGGGPATNAVEVANTSEFASVSIVSEDFFSVMSAAPLAGRLFTPAETRYGAEPLAVISDAFWKRRFAANPQAIGSPVRAYGQAFTVIGILAAGFSFPGQTDVWIGHIDAKNTSRSAHNWRVIARLKPGATLGQAQSELDALGARLAAAYPNSNRTKTLQAIPVREQMVAGVRTTLWLLLGSVGLVLLIACANVANLLLARATARRREIAVRAALGASRGRIARQLLIESAVLSLIAAAAGLALALWGIDTLIRVAPQNLPRLDEVRVDPAVLFFTLAVSLTASILFGLAPALQASRVDLNETLKQGGRGSIGVAGGRLRGALVVAEVAISMVLLVGAGLVIRSFESLSRVELGFRTDHLLVLETNFPAESLAAARRSNAVYTDVARQVAAVPGVLSASAAMGLAGGPTQSNGSYFLEGGPSYEQIGMAAPQADFFVVMPDYFRTIGVPFRTGRDFDPRDAYDAPFTVIVNEALVRHSFPNTDPIGRRIQCGLDSRNFMTIVGVVADFRSADPALPVRPAMFMPYLQHPFPGTRMTFVAHTAADPMALSDSVRRTVRGVSTLLPARFGTMEVRLSTTVASPRFRSILFGTFAALAVLLAMAGVYGVMAYTVVQRSSEIGLRIALGADRTRIIGHILTGGLKLAALGLIAGFACAWPAVRLLESMLFDVTRTDPATWIEMAAALTLATIVACAIPALRAARLHPLDALREE